MAGTAIIRNDKCFQTSEKEGRSLVCKVLNKSKKTGRSDVMLNLQFCREIFGFKLTWVTKTTKDLGLMLLETLERLVCSPLFQKTGLGGESYMKLPDEDNVSHVEYFPEGI